MLNHPEVFEPRARPAIRRLKRAETINCQAARQREIARVWHDYFGFSEGRAAPSSDQHPYQWQSPPNIKRDSL